MSIINLCGKNNIYGKFAMVNFGRFAIYILFYTLISIHLLKSTVKTSYKSYKRPYIEFGMFLAILTINEQKILGRDLNDRGLMKKVVSMLV